MARVFSRAPSLHPRMAWGVAVARSDVLVDSVALVAVDAAFALFELDAADGVAPRDPCCSPDPRPFGLAPSVPRRRASDSAGATFEGRPSGQS
jgi:hypothetical protein